MNKQTLAVRLAAINSRVEAYWTVNGKIDLTPKQSQRIQKKLRRLYQESLTITD